MSRFIGILLVLLCAITNAKGEPQHEVVGVPANVELSDKVFRSGLDGYMGLIITDDKAYKRAVHLMSKNGSAINLPIIMSDSDFTDFAKMMQKALDWINIANKEHVGTNKAIGEMSIGGGPSAYTLLKFRFTAESDGKKPRLFLTVVKGEETLVDLDEKAVRTIVADFKMIESAQERLDKKVQADVLFK